MNFKQLERVYKDLENLSVVDFLSLHPSSKLSTQDPTQQHPLLNHFLLHISQDAVLHRPRFRPPGSGRSSGSSRLFGTSSLSRLLTGPGPQRSPGSQCAPGPGCFGPQRARHRQQDVRERGRPILRVLPPVRPRVRREDRRGLHRVPHLHLPGDAEGQHPVRAAGRRRLRPEGRQGPLPQLSGGIKCWERRQCGWKRCAWLGL